MTADSRGDHTLRCQNRTGRHNFVCARLKKILISCGYKILVEQGASIHDRTRPGDLLVKNWKPGEDLYIDVSVIDPTGQQWRNNLILGGAGEAANLKELEKINYYKNHFNLADKRHEFAPFILESQGGI